MRCVKRVNCNSRWSSLSRWVTNHRWCCCASLPQWVSLLRVYLYESCISTHCHARTDLIYVSIKAHYTLPVSTGRVHGRAREHGPWTRIACTELNSDEVRQSWNVQPLNVIETYSNIQMLKSQLASDSQFHIRCPVRESRHRYACCSAKHIPDLV